MAEVLVLEGVSGPGIDGLQDEFTLERAPALHEAQRLDGVRGLVVRNATRVDAEALARLPDLAVVGRAGAGLDNIDVAAASAAGVAVTYAPAENTAATAEHTLALALALAHRIPELDADVRGGGWDRRQGAELRGETWGVVGMGRIGRAVAALARGIGMRTIAHDPVVGDDEIRAAGAEPRALEAVMAEARVVSLHVPLTSATRGLVGRELLARMREDAFLVNTARGELVDEAALAEALAGGRPAGAALDVRDPEPPGAADPLIALPQVVLTPHVAGLSREAQVRVTDVVARDVRAVLRGEVPAYPAPAA
jgi:D-3-phosphoglycerate dehydrogenase / 2-oxoglutarate reductase